MASRSTAGLTDRLLNSTSDRNVFLRTAYSLYRATRQELDSIPPVKRSLRFAAQIKNILLDSPRRNRRQMELLYRSQVDPYGFSREAEQMRFRCACRMLDAVMLGRRFQYALEIGCAEGMFTIELANRCNSVFAVDISSIALERARQRCRAAKNIEFGEWDLRTGKLERSYDLIVATGVLEYLSRPRDLRDVCQRLVEALHLGGYLLVGTTIQDDDIERSWVARWLSLGANINSLVGQHPSLRLLDLQVHQCARPFAHSLFQKRLVISSSAS
jgi:2-polyprenyl-3-methyl-5-hydroxy-6-metoxy-1,4-benzoquinol methylase